MKTPPHGFLAALLILLTLLFSTTALRAQVTPPTVTTSPASAIGLNSAVLNGLVRRNGAPTTYRFEWGGGGVLDRLTPVQNLGAWSETQLVSAVVTGLALNTEYSFRLRATNSAGTTLGSVLTFSTPPLTIGADGRWTLLAGKTWRLAGPTIIPADLLIAGGLDDSAGYPLTVLGTLTVLPTAVLVKGKADVRSFFRDGILWAGYSSLAQLETVATFGLVGAQPMARLLEGGDGWIYGVTASGGKSGLGAAYRVKATGEAELLASFTGANGQSPQSALVGSEVSGGIYGTTTGGGAMGKGTVFRVLVTSVFKVADFNGTDGRAPNGGLTLGPGGLRYGVASHGGTLDKGTLFRLNGSVIEKLVDFTGPNGAVPQAAMIVGSDGALYGTTTYGGAVDVGAVFRFDPATGVMRVLASLDGTTGAYPVGGLIEGTPGVFYGTCYAGGANGMGTVFRVGGSTPEGTELVGALRLASFSSSVGSGPIGPLALGADGNFYGTTYTGSAGYGAIFKVTDAGTLSRVTPVLGHGGTGAHPGAGLLLGTDGAWYGVSQDGGLVGRGAVFRVLLSGVMENVASFTDNQLPSGLTVGPVDGQLYGTTQRGGATGSGSVFALAPGVGATALGSFAPGVGQEPYPGAGVSFGTDGTLYGTAAAGGASGKGVVWKLPPGGALAALAKFNGVNGATPLGGLVPAGDGGFFGTTAGAGGPGNVFKVSPAGLLTPQGNFTGANGANPYAGLAADGTGAFLGTTRAGGSSGLGTIYKLTPGAGLALVASFTGSNGQEPLAPLIGGTDGTFAGTSRGGGAGGKGTVYTTKPGDAIPSVTTRFSFAGLNGEGPAGALLATGDGGFFGTTSAGGGFGKGTVFRLGALGTLQTIAHLTGGSDGAAPTTGLVAAPDGYLYGSTDATVFRVPYAPSVTTRAATPFTPTFTTLRGVAEPRGLSTTVTFDWGTTSALGSTLAAGTRAGTSASPFQAELPGLIAGTTYYYRAVATNVMGVKRGSVLKFKTPSLLANPGGGYTLPAGTTWKLPGDFTFAGDLTILGTLDTAGYVLTVPGKLTVGFPGSVLNATGRVAYLDRDGALPPGKLELLGNAAHDGLDSDGDGLSALMEFVLGTNPSVLSVGALPVPAVIGGYLTLTYTTPAGLTGAVGIVETSTDLLSWSSGPGFTETLSDTITAGVRTVTVRANPPASPQYLRLRASR